jgi:hypothetical protein
MFLAIDAAFCSAERVTIAGPIGYGYRDHVELIDAAEVRRIARVDRKVVRYGRRCDHRIVGSGRGLAACPPERRGDPPKRARRVSVERERVEVSLGLLQVGLTGGALILIGRNERPDRELRERHRRDNWFLGERRGIRKALQQDQRRGVEDASSRACRRVRWRRRAAHRLASRI